jgi:hypothetical protein
VANPHVVGWPPEKLMASSAKSATKLSLANRHHVTRERPLAGRGGHPDVTDQKNLNSGEESSNQLLALSIIETGYTV